MNRKIIITEGKRKEEPIKYDEIVNKYVEFDRRLELLESINDKVSFIFGSYITFIILVFIGLIIWIISLI